MVADLRTEVMIQNQKAVHSLLELHASAADLTYSFPFDNGQELHGLRRSRVSVKSAG